MYSFSCIGNTIAFGEIAKAWLAILSVVVPALWVRSRADFLAGVLGLGLAVSLLAVVALRSASDVTSEGVNPMETANKNSYSLYALPAIYLAGFVVLTFPNLRLWLKLVLLGCVAIPVMAILVSGNRSGWLGAAIVVLLFIMLLLKSRKIAGVLIISAIGAIIAIWLVRYANTEVAARRITDTKTGRTSDRFRFSIFTKCVQIGIENPVIGVSPQMIGREIGKRAQGESQMDIIDSHNIFGHVIAASGLICFGALIATGWTMWRWPVPPAAKQASGAALRHAVTAVQMLIFLWAVRGFFSREILYNPGFCTALGLIIGWRSVVTDQFKSQWLNHES
jgi:O-antigen ligase